jgi:hypothetical protein
MLKNFRDKVALSGITVLLIGVALLIFTFISAYGFLTQSLSIVTSADLAQTFGATLAPLIATCIRLMYLGIMGWVASLVTIRGVAIITHTPQQPTPHPQRPPNIVQSPEPQEKPVKPKSEEAKEEKTKQPEKSDEPDVAFIPPEAIPQPQLPNA